MQQKFIKLVKFKKLSAEKSVTSILDLRALLGLQGVSEIKKVCYSIFVWNQSCYVIWMSDLQFKHITGIYLQYEHPTIFSVFTL